MPPEQFVTKGVNTLQTQEIDVAKWFWETFGALYRQAPKSSLNQARENENSKYADSIFGVKNAYLSFATGDDAENIIYSFATYAHVTNVLNSVSVIGTCANIYQSTDVTDSSSIFYSRFIIHSNNIRFSTNMTWCMECIDCDGLDNQSYCIQNMPYSKEEYAMQKQKLLQDKASFMQKYIQNMSVVGANIGSQNVQGDRIIFSENIQDGYLASRIQNGRNIYLTAGVNSCTNFYDCFEVWLDSHDMYAVAQAGTYGQKIYCSNFIDGGSNIYYSIALEQCSYCLWCIGLKNKSFCIFNTQYTQEEWFNLANKLFETMDGDWTLWAFFPWWMNPFYFNDTAAYLIDDSFTKEEVMKEGYLWREEEIKVDIPANAEVVLSCHPDSHVSGEGYNWVQWDSSPSAQNDSNLKSLDDFQWYNDTWEWEINPEILKKVIKDEKGNYYRIVPMELEFLQKYGLPLPELHRLERIKLGFKFT